MDTYNAIALEIYSSLYSILTGEAFHSVLKAVSALYARYARRNDCIVLTPMYLTRAKAALVLRSRRL